METKKSNYWIKSGSYTLASNVQSVLFGFGGFYLLVRILDKHQFGVWALFIATTSIFEMARSGLVQNALVKFLSHSTNEERHDIITASIFLNGILMIAGIIINISMAGFLSELWHYPGLVNMFLCYSFVYLVQGALLQFQWIEQANFSFSGIMVSNTIKQGGFFFFLLACFFWHISVSLLQLIYAQGIIALVSAMVEYFYVRKYFFFSLRIDFGWVKKLFNYGKFVFGTSISTVLANTINQMMIGAYWSVDAAGVFNVASRINNLVDIPSVALSTIVFPQSAKRFASEGHDAIKYLYEKSVGTILAVLIPAVLFLFLFPDLVVHIVAGKNYNDSVLVVKYIAIACLFNPFGLLFGTVLDSIGKPKINFALLVVFMALKLILNFILIKAYGVMGAVYATIIADIIIFIVQMTILKKEFGVKGFNTLVYAIQFYPEFLDKMKSILAKRSKA